MNYRKQGLSQIKDTLWYDLLNNQTKKSSKKENGNVIVLGDPGCGKKSLIVSMLNKLGQTNEVSSLAEKSILKDFSGKFEDIYVLDYKYIKVNKYSDDESFEELGKINFYIFNKKHEVIS
jgi:polynucleotide 5'-kinase involved in rRNA processing